MEAKKMKAAIAKVAATCVVALECLAANGVSAAGDSIPPEPQLIKDAWLLETYFEADPEAIKAVLPPGLKPDPSNTVMVNMYTVPEDSNTSGLGAYTLTYLTIQVAGHDGYIYGASEPIPGRYWVHYWNSSERMRAYTKRAGIPDDKGGVTTMTRTPTKVTTRLTLQGKAFIEASSDLSGAPQPPAGGHTNYLFGKGNQLKLMTVPWICGDIKAENPAITFLMPQDHPAYKLRPKKVVFSGLYHCTFSYPQTVTIKP
jgi:Acetoacetate decarboxylase (ADC)